MFDFKTAGHELAEMNRQQMEQARANAPQQPMGLMDRIGQGFSKMMADQDFKDRLIIGLQGMTTNPNQAMIQMAQDNIKRRRDMATLNKQTNRTIEFLRARGVPESELKALQDNPQMLMAYAQAVLKRQGQKPTAPKSYAPMVDPVTGQVVVPTYDATTGKASFSQVEGLTQLTPEEKARLETQQRAEQADVLKAQEKAEEAMTQASAIESKLPLYLDIIRSIDEGADSGIIMSRLPATNEATASLRSAANQLGITVINSATFGALSESELNLALSTEIPQNLPPERLKEYVIRRYEAQAKLANEIRKKARQLATSGMTYTDYIKQSTMNDIPTTLPEVVISDEGGVRRR